MFSVKNSSCIKRIDEGGGIILVIMRLSSVKAPGIGCCRDAGDFRTLQKWWPNAFLENHRYYAARGNR